MKKITTRFYLAYTWWVGYCCIQHQHVDTYVSFRFGSEWAMSMHITNFVCTPNPFHGFFSSLDSMNGIRKGGVSSFYVWFSCEWWSHEKLLHVRDDIDSAKWHFKALKSGCVCDIWDLRAFHTHTWTRMYWIEVVEKWLIYYIIQMWRSFFLSVLSFGLILITHRLLDYVRHKSIDTYATLWWGCWAHNDIISTRQSVPFNSFSCIFTCWVLTVIINASIDTFTVLIITLVFFYSWSDKGWKWAHHQ